MTSAEEDVPSPAAVSGYLRSAGWAPIDAGDAWAQWRRVVDGHELILTVPLRGHAPDYRRRFEELVDDLRRLERRTGEQIVRDIRSSSSDVIRLRLRGSSEYGRISVEQGARAFQRTRDLLLAAACAAVEKRPIYAGRKPARAIEYIQRARFGPTEGGSFVLTVESSVAPQLTDSPAVDDGEPEPFERAVCLALAEGASAARRIVDQLSVTSSAETVASGVARGVSSNLCEALAGLLDDAGAAQSLELSFRWAAVRPAAAAPQGVIFEHEAARFLSVMSQTLREQGEIADFELIGPVQKLTSAAPDQGGEVVVVSTRDPWPGRKVRVAFTGSAYRHVASAHADGLWITCEGVLVRQGSALVLLEPRNLVAFAPWRTLLDRLS